MLITRANAHTGTTDTHSGATNSDTRPADAYTRTSDTNPYAYSTNADTGTTQQLRPNPRKNPKRKNLRPEKPLKSMRLVRLVCRPTMPCASRVTPMPQLP